MDGRALSLRFSSKLGRIAVLSLVHRIAIVSLALFAGACAHVTAPRGVDAWAWPADPQAAFAAVEKRLQDARTVEIDAHIIAGGALGADITSELALASGNRAHLDASGQLGASTLEASL